MPATSKTNVRILTDPILKVIVLLVGIFTITFFKAPLSAPKFLAELLFFISSDISPNF